MPAGLPVLNRPLPLVLVALAVAGLVSACRALGFGDGVLLGATPASGLALGAAVVLRAPGATAAAAGFALAGFALAGFAWGPAPGAVATDAIAHGLAAVVAAFAMRTLARRREVRTRTNDWLIFLAGACVFTTIVAGALFVGGTLGALGPPSTPMQTALRALVFEPFGILTFGAVLASLRELPRIRSDPRPALGVLALGVFLLAVLWVLLSLPLEQVSPSGVTLLLSVPFCLWVAMQRRSLDGAALSFVASHVGLLLLLRSVGSIDRAEYITAIAYLNVLVATCQLVHAVNLDRLAALAEVQARKHDLEERVALRTAHLNAMMERALAADAAKTRFLATVSHEVRTPLNGVLGMASVILAGRLHPETRRNVEIIRTSGHHMLDVINRILDYSRLGHAPRGEDVSEFDLRAVVAEVLQEARFLPCVGDLALRADLAPELHPWRKGYRHGLRQVLTNLVGNAAKFTAAGSVTVRIADLPEDRIRVEVEDTGIGIDPSDLERIFLPYEQAEAGPGPQGGTGLGLAICAEVVRRMGGTIGVESALGDGSLFWFEVPLPSVTEPEDRPPLTMHS